MTDPDPTLVDRLAEIFGGPVSTAFGSAVFHMPSSAQPEDGLEAAAKAVYRRFLGDSWDRAGESVWLTPWRTAYARPVNGKPAIVEELRGVSDPAAKNSVPLLLDLVENPAAGQAALSAAFDDPAMRDVRLYTIGDGEAMSGLILAGARDGGERIFVVTLMD